MPDSGSAAPIQDTQTVAAAGVSAIPEKVLVTLPVGGTIALTVGIAASAAITLPVSGTVALTLPPPVL